jgi:hypothetical protein
MSLLKFELDVKFEFEGRLGTLAFAAGFDFTRHPAAELRDADRTDALSLEPFARFERTAVAHGIENRESSIPTPDRARTRLTPYSSHPNSQHPHSYR